MRRLNKFLLPLLAVLLVTGCQKDIIVKDIKDKNISVLAPGDGISTPNNSVTFWWNEVDGAEKYELQIVSPNFASIAQLIADTNVTGDKYVQVLQPGSYQWRIRATNNGGSTPWVTRSLTIDTTSNLAYLNIALSSPADCTFTNVAQQTFSWSPVSAANIYHFRLYNSTAPGTAISSSDPTITTATYSFTVEGSYTWSVSASNNYSNSPYSSRKLFYDITPPTIPAPNHPGIGATASIGSDTLKWSSAVSGAYYDSLYVATDTSFLHTVVTAQLSSHTQKYAITNSNFVIGTTYYWKVKSIDRAGNRSAFSARRNFTTN